MLWNLKRKVENRCARQKNYLNAARHTNKLWIHCENGWTNQRWVDIEIPSTTNLAFREKCLKVEHTKTTRAPIGFPLSSNLLFEQLVLLSSLTLTFPLIKTIKKQQLRMTLSRNKKVNRFRFSYRTILAGFWLRSNQIRNLLRAIHKVTLRKR